tara:strand:- start:6052 stop:8697 length:2646 start_codon:yes stop_codon:yes gene_type:complete
MPKYILDTKGKIIERDNPKNEKNATELAGEYTGKAGSYHEDKIEFRRLSNINLPLATSVFDSSSDEKKHTIGSVTPSFAKLQPDDEEDIFPERKDNNFLINPSFGADKPVKFYKNFNDYLNSEDNDNKQGSIFADELEMIAGLEFNDFGVSDLSRFLFVFDYIFESIAYIVIIEAILAIFPNTGEVAYDDDNRQLGHNFKLQLGSSGPVQYDALSRFIRQVLQYPADRRSEGPLERLGAYFIGLSLYVNSDPKIYGLLDYLKHLSKTTVISPIGEIAAYVFESLFSLSKVGQNRLFMLIRRFHQKADWHKNVLYKAKENSPENVVDKLIVELNYYYVKFVIERINIGLKLKKRYKKEKRKRLNRSGKIKDSLTKNNFAMINQDSRNHREIKIKQVSFKNNDINRQSMSIHALPQAFVLPESFRRSYNVNSGEDFGKAHVNDRINSYFIKTKKSQERLSPKAVAEMEAFYEKEMMPFYFHDLRTNEIIGFHAFIESIVDNYNPNYNPTKGFGRIDPIQHYMDTTRNVNITFTLAAMSPEDHDLMWYQINKIVSMCYPQWSGGFKKKTSVDGIVKDDPNGKDFPFTQVPTASPLIRIRLGDVIKSNYTKHAIEKIHGSSSKPKEITELPEEMQEFDTKFYLKSGFYRYAQPRGGANSTSPKKYYIQKQEVMVSDRGGMTSFYSSSEDFSEFMDPVNAFKYRDSYIINKNDLIMNKEYFIQFKKPGFNPMMQSNSDEVIALGSQIEVRKVRRNKSNDAKKLLSENKKIKESHKKVFNDYTKAYDEAGNVNNPVTAAYETTLGKGLAGFITMLDVNYNDQLWETEVIGAKAPKLVKMNINFAPIHDIPPGLDADGSMRAPVYNTGEIIKYMYGDVYDIKKVKDRS